MKKARIARLIAAAAALQAWQVSAHDTQVDLTRLPLGDHRLSQEPKVGWIWACHMEHGGGAHRDGPWIRDDGTFDLTAKAIVTGSVNWPHTFTMSTTDTARVFSSNDLPAHATGTFPIAPDDPATRYDRNPNAIAAQNIRLTLPLNPVLAKQPACAPGVVGIMLTGVVLFNSLDAMGRDAVAHEVQDKCQGHPQRTGTYHYHSLTGCQEDPPLADGHSALLGYALDGFGIFGRHGEGGKILTSADLDACHGHTHKIPWNGKMVEMYHYHGTWDFPYTVGCIRGTVDYRNIVHAGVLPMPPEAAGEHPFGQNGNGKNRHGPPNLSAAAANLGIPVERLMRALGPPPPDLARAAAKLGISEDELMRALRH